MMFHNAPRSVPRIAIDTQSTRVAPAPPRLNARKARNSALDIIITSLNQMANFAQCSGLPYISPIILLGLEIVKAIQQMRENKDALAQLAHDTHGMLKTIADLARERRGLSGELERGVVAFSGVLQSVLAFVKEQQYRGVLRRFFVAADDVRKIEGCRSQIQTARDSFEMGMEMRMHENLVAILNERRASLPPPAYETIHIAIPDEINIVAETEFERLLDILGVVSVLQDDSGADVPTALWIARVLNVEESDISDVWDPISAYFATAGLDVQRRGRCLRYLEGVVCRKAGIPSIDTPKNHSMAALWCLGPKVCARDAFYAADYWVFHVCQSSPSPELLDALKKSDMPLDPLVQDDLPEIISWIEGIPDADERWKDLLKIYQRQLSGELLNSPYLEDGWIKVEV